MTAICYFCGEHVPVTRADSRTLDGGPRVAEHKARCAFWPKPTMTHTGGSDG